MEIIKSKNGKISYREMIWIDGKSIKSPSFQRKTDCKIWLAKQQNAKAQNQLHGDQTKLRIKISLADYCLKWLDCKKAQGVARSSFRNYESYVRIHITSFFKTLDIKAVQKHDVEKFQIQLIKSHNAKGTNLIINALKSIFREAIRDGYVLKSPCDYIKSISANNIYDVFWSKDEINQFLLANYNHELHDLFLIAINTGLRKGELAGLCWDRVNFADNTISVTRTRDRYEIKERTKTNIKRFLPMNEVVRMTLLNIRKQNHDAKYVFVLKNGELIKPHHLYRQFSLAQKKAGMGSQIRFHDLRHTFASQYIINGGSVYDLQKFMGHTDIKMTSRYAHHSMDYLQNAMQGFSLGSAKKTSDLNLELIAKDSNLISLKSLEKESFSQNLTSEVI